MPLKAGTKGDLADSMAKAIENAFQQEWPKVMGNTPLSPPGPELQLLFVAIAQGVVRHLVSHAESFKVEVNDTGGLIDEGQVTQITTQGTLY